MNDTYQKILDSFEPLNRRKLEAQRILDEIVGNYKEHFEVFNNKNISVYCAGSLARKDVGTMSDMDLFIVSGEANTPRLEEVEMLSAIIRLNRDLGYKEFSNDGQFLKVYCESEMIKALGAPRDDAENLFTTRMLLLLESHPIFNNPLYDNFLDDTINHYFRDSRGRKSFRPLFLLNDMLRWWRTVCLNYEGVRDLPGRPWRKKNINLKFSRMLTVFGTILPLIAKPMDCADDVKSLSKLTPHQRFAYGLDLLKDRKLKEGYEKFLENYEYFLELKESIGRADQVVMESVDQESRRVASEFSDFIFSVLSHKSIDPTLRKYLVL